MVGQLTKTRRTRVLINLSRGEFSNYLGEKSLAVIDQQERRPTDDRTKRSIRSQPFEGAGEGPWLTVCWSRLNHSMSKKLRLMDRLVDGKRISSSARGNTRRERDYLDSHRHHTKRRAPEHFSRGFRRVITSKSYGRGARKVQ